MDVGAVGLKVASSVVVPLLKRLVLPPPKAPGAEFRERPVRITGLLSFAGDHPALSKDDMHRLASELVRRAVRATGPGERPIEDDEHDAVGQALTRTLFALGELDMDDVQVFVLGPERLAERLSRQAGPDTRRLLTRDAALFHDQLLQTACVHLVRFFTQRPGFAARAQLEEMRELREQSEQLEIIRRRVSGDDWTTADARFEESYAHYVVKRHGSLTIYGVDLRDPGGQEWSLESAYLSPRAVAAPAAAAEESDAVEAVRDTELEESVETALAGRGRVLLHGLAGTGKTTLVQWLAITTARQEKVPGHLPQLLGRVPFVLPLRTLAREGTELPLPQDFLRWMGCPLVGTEPDGWAARVLQNGRGLLLIDGLDEIPKGDRTRTRVWLRGLLAAFPGNLWLATTRPSALDPGWLAREGFHELTLNALRPADLRVFIQRWHTAAGAREGLGDELTEALRAGPELSRLATNPLMCSLICALHRERRGFLPRGRAALYKAALSMLLERRDMERELFGRGGHAELDEEAATEPLKRLAYWLIRNERTQIERADAVDVVRRLQPQVPSLQQLGEPEDALQYLLERSGLLREPSVGAVDFVHRTFQDYLGAKAVLEERDFGILVKNAHVDQWEDVVQMAVAQSDHNGRADLLMRLSDRGNREKDPTVQARLRLLALASLEQATRLDPAVRRTIETEAARMLPPRSLRQARVLARTGPLLLQMLPHAGELSGDEELATVHAICQIGGDSAIPRLREFLDTRQCVVRAQLLGHWDRFDTRVYAEEIIGPLLAADPTQPVTVRSRAELDALAVLPGCERVGIHGDFDPAAVRAALDPTRLRELRLRGALQLDDLGPLADFTHLESLTLQGCRNVKDPAPLTLLPALRTLVLEDLPQFEPLARLADCPRLTELHLGAQVPWRGLADLPHPERLRVLALPPGTVEMAEITRCTALEELRLHDAGERLMPDHWAGLLAAREGAEPRLPALHTLTLSPEQLSMLLFFGPSTGIPQIKYLYVYAKPGAPVSLRRIAGRLPGLAEIHLTQGTDIHLRSLKGLTGLRRVRLAYPGEVQGASDLPDGVDLEIYPHP
ncbi:NACHT domain-containing protein [Streptomyces sp. NPDC005562]|uniref:NACHT domain-containing protein n=1 Tax=Streptomyces sp. NPDC005562 TaxID=3154890 RepID=UPI0033A0D301